MSILRVATYNIHKGVQGLGPARRLEIHNLAHAVEQFDADIVCLQEVRRHHRKLEKHFTRWPDLDQAGYLSPEGYESVYRTNAVTRHGEHGNALLSRWPVLDTRHSDVSDHRFEQRGLLHVQLMVDGKEVHVVVVHFGLIHASRERQVERLGRHIAQEVPPGAALIVAGVAARMILWDAGPFALIKARACSTRSKETVAIGTPCKWMISSQLTFRLIVLQATKIPTVLRLLTKQTSNCLTALI